MKKEIISRKPQRSSRRPGSLVSGSSATFSCYYRQFTWCHQLHHVLPQHCGGIDRTEEGEDEDMMLYLKLSLRDDNGTIPLWRLIISPLSFPPWRVLPPNRPTRRTRTFLADSISGTLLLSAGRQHDLWTREYFMSQAELATRPPDGAAAILKGATNIGRRITQLFTLPLSPIHFLKCSHTRTQRDRVCGVTLESTSNCV